MSPRAVRWVVVAVCAGGIAGMIVGSIADDNTVTLTFGLVTAAAAVCLIVATAVAAGSPAEPDEEVARRVEDQVNALVAGGAHEAAVRDLVRDAVILGRSQTDRRRPSPKDGEVGAGVHGGRTPRPDSRTFT